MMIGIKTKFGLLLTTDFGCMLHQWTSRLSSAGGEAANGKLVLIRSVALVERPVWWHRAGHKP